LRIPKNIAKKFKQLKNIILASCQAETGRDRAKKEKKNLSFGTVFTRPELENSKINSKKIILASFQAETRLGQDEKKRKKISHSEPFLPDPSLRIPKKIAQKF